MAKSRKSSALSVREKALVRAALAVPPPQDLPKLSADSLIARWKAYQAREKSPAVVPLPKKPEAEPLRLAARSGEKISPETEARIRHLLKHGGKPPKDVR